MQAVSPGRKTLAEMARWTPAAITAWRFGRLLKAVYWNVHLLVSWLAQDLLATLPAPANGIVYLFGDGSHADKRGTKNPVAQKGRISQHHPWFFGLRFVLGHVPIFLVSFPAAQGVKSPYVSTCSTGQPCSMTATGVWPRHWHDTKRGSALSSAG
jgi:hypothetical protein